MLRSKLRGSYLESNISFWGGPPHQINGWRLLILHSHSQDWNRGNPIVTSDHTPRSNVSLVKASCGLLKPEVEFSGVWRSEQGKNPKLQRKG